MRRLLLGALMVLLQGCESSESIVAVVVSLLGVGAVAAGIAGRKHNRDRSQEHADQVAAQREDRARWQDNIEDQMAQRELARKFEDVRAAAEKKGIRAETDARLAQVERDGGLSQALLDEMLEEIES